MASVRVEQDGAVGIVTLDRPEARNALSPQLMEELAAAIGGRRATTWAKETASSSHLRLGVTMFTSPSCSAS